MEGILETGITMIRGEISMNNYTHKCKIITFQSRGRGTWYYEIVSDLDREAKLTGFT